MKIAKESWVIMAIGLADLITTIIFIQNHGAEEANPLFRRYWEMGLMAFIFAKLALLVGPLWVLEWARKRNPAFVSWALRSAIAGYLIMYGIGFIRLNSPAAHADEMASMSTAPPNRTMLLVYKHQMSMMHPHGLHGAGDKFGSFTDFATGPAMRYEPHSQPPTAGPFSAPASDAGNLSGMPTSLTD
ncbi:MAG TPA: DUF5658 family protein [Chthonomonadaceae bacterium]|nr:DUF5658 family protein [Chthonomonadaceae bacterium]